MWFFYDKEYEGKNKYISRARNMYLFSIKHILIIPNTVKRTNKSTDYNLSDSDYYTFIIGSRNYFQQIWTYCMHIMCEVRIFILCVT